MPVIRMYKNNDQLPKEALRNDQISLKSKGNALHADEP